MVLADDLLDGLDEVVPQVPAIRDLHRVGGPDPDAFGVGAGPVAAHDLRAGVLAQPRRESVGGPVAEQVQRPVGGEVDHDRAVDVSPAQREVVDAQRLRCCDGRVGEGADQPHQGVAADDDAELVGETGAGAPGQREPDRLQHRAQRPGPPSTRTRQSGDLLGERPRRAVGVVAEEPPYPQHDLTGRPPIGASAR